MPTPFVLTLPAGDEKLRDEIIEHIKQYAEVQEAPPTFGLDEIKLVIDVISAGVGILGNAAAIATFILLLKDRRKQNRGPGRIQIARMGEQGIQLESADEQAVRRIVGLDELREKK